MVICQKEMMVCQKEDTEYETKTTCQNVRVPSETMRGMYYFLHFILGQFYFLQYLFTYVVTLYLNMVIVLTESVRIFGFTSFSFLEEHVFFVELQH